MTGMTRNTFEPDHILLTLADLQRGCAARDQLRDLGIGDHTIDRRLATGLWVNVAPSIYRHRARPVTWDLRAAAAFLEAHAAAVLGGRTAIGLLGCDWAVAPGHVPTLLVPHTRTHTSRIAIVRQVIEFPSDEVVSINPFSTSPTTTVGGNQQQQITSTAIEIRVTSLVRSMVDLGCWSYPNQFTEFTAFAMDMMRRGHVRQDELLKSARAAHQARRRHARFVAGWLESREFRAPELKGLELDAHRWFDEWGLSPFLEYEVPHPAFPGTNKRADALCRSVRLIIELDSRQHHLSEAGFESDRLRDLQSLGAGYRTIRLTAQSFSPEQRDRTKSLLRRLCGLDGGLDGAA
jgi:hypothetical protein